MNAALRRFRELASRQAAHCWRFIRRMPQRRYFKVGLIVLVLLSLAGAWAATLIEPTINKQDPVVVAKQFMQDLQADKPNHAYQFASSKLRHNYDSADFATKVVADLTSQWPQYPAQFVGTRPVPDGDKNRITVGFIVPSDGELKAQQVFLSIARTKDGAPWQVDVINTVTEINGKLEPGAL